MDRSRARVVLALIVLLLSTRGLARAGPTGSSAGEGSVIFFPEERAYETYLADPWMPGFSLNLMHVSEVGIDDAGEGRLNLKLGGSFGFLRLRRSGWQFSVECGYNGQADVSEDSDIIGWDGIAGLQAARSLSHGLSIRLSPLMHRSAHLGDEYIERTGRMRIEYTREEYTAGLSWNILDHWRIYGDAGYAFTTRSDLQERWRTQGGVEWVHPEAMRGGRAGLYAAVNAMSWQEKDWDIDVSAAAGFLFRTSERDWRLGILLHHGTATLGEFFEDDETFGAAGVWLDL